MFAKFPNILVTLIEILKYNTVFSTTLCNSVMTCRWLPLRNKQLTCSCCVFYTVKQKVVKVFKYKQISKLNMDQIEHTSDSDPLAFEPGTNVDPIKLEYHNQDIKPRPVISNKTDKFEVSCPLCADIFWTCQSVVRHILQVHPNERVAQFKCHICSAKYKNAKLVFDHWNLKHKNKSHLVCQFCKKHFRLKQYLNEHMKKCHNNTIMTLPFQKDLKNKQVDTTFDMHLKSDIESEEALTESESVTVKEEEEGEKEEKSDIEHMQEINSNEEANLKIEIGSTEFQEDGQDMFEPETAASQNYNCEAEVNIDTDMKSEHVEQENTDELVLNLNAQQQCPYCDLILATNQSMKSHFMEIHADITNAECNVCSKTYINYQKLSQHANVIHIHTCNICHQLFDAERKLTEHKEIEHNLKLECSKCLVKFKVKSCLKKHIQSKKCSLDNIKASKMYHEAKGNTSTEPQKCPYCNITLAANHNMKTHFMAAHVDITNDECAVCSKKYINYQQLSQHVNVIHIHTCNICQQLFNAEHKLTEHKEIEHNLKLECSKCFAQFKVKTSLNKHIQSKKCQNNRDNVDAIKRYNEAKGNLTKSLKCPYCDLILAPNQSMKTHFMATHADITNAECNVCSKKYINYQQLSMHVVQIHIHTCNICQQLFGAERKLTEHKEIEHYLKLECSKCLASFHLKGSLKRHIQANKCKAKFKHLISPQRQVEYNNCQTPPDSRKGRYCQKEAKCPVYDCNKIFKLLTMRHHIKTSHPEVKQFNCKTCLNSTFGKYILYYKHIIGVHIQPSFPCTVATCTQTFSGRTALKKHIMVFHEKKKVVGVHENEKNVCHICGFSSVWKHELKLHILRVHENAKPFQCDLCSTKFSSRRNLTNHIKVVHEGIKPFECPECHKMFANKQKLKDHVKVHKDTRDYNCSHCDVGFTVKTSLNVHMKFVHNGVRPFQCSVCEETFLQKTSLEAHIKRNHNTSF